MTTPTAEQILRDPAWRRTELTRSEWLALRLADSMRDHAAVKDALMMALAEVERLNARDFTRCSICGSVHDWRVEEIAKVRRERDEARAQLAEREALWHELRRLEALRYHDAHQEEDYRALCRKLGLRGEGPC